MKGKNSAAAAVGLLADPLVRFPKRLPHPLAYFGSFMNRIEERLYRDDAKAGLAYTAVGLGSAVLASRLVPSRALATWLCVGGAQLHDVAEEVAVCLRTENLAGAQELMPSLVGRAPEYLDEIGVARAAIESVAENTVDAIIAPAFWATVGGSAGVMAHRSVDTMDSMVGYRNKRYENFGFASARLDDAMAYLPARLTVGLVTLVRPEATRAVFKALRQQSNAHTSPNARVVEATFAAALNVQLGGPVRYETDIVERPYIGLGPVPGADDIAAAVKLSKDVSLAAATLLAGFGAGRAFRL